MQTSYQLHKDIAYLRVGHGLDSAMDWNWSELSGNFTDWIGSDRMAAISCFRVYYHFKEHKLSKSNTLGMVGVEQCVCEIGRTSNGRKIGTGAFATF